MIRSLRHVYNPFERLAVITLHRLLAPVAVAILLAQPGGAHAGMPTVTLTEVPRMRLQTISFFLMGFLLSAWLIQRLWNYLAKDFVFLPRLTYGKALGVVGLWGTLFVLVLTMISGARELMTPGAWEKHGSTYRLAPVDEEAAERARQAKLDQLRTALWDYARTHEERFPSDNTITEIPSEKWQTSDPSGMRYLYVPGRCAGRGVTPLAYEPDIFGPWRLVLFTNGDVRRLTTDELTRALAREGR
jgi:hypothetical protein